MGTNSWSPPEDAIETSQQTTGGFTPPQDVQQFESNPYIAAAKSALESTPEAVGGAVGGIPGAVSGAGLGLRMAGMPGAIIGGALGGTAWGGLAAETTKRIVDPLLKRFIPDELRTSAGFSEQQRESERQQYPLASKAGEFVPDILTMAMPRKAAEKGMMNFAANKLWAQASPAQRDAWKIADDWGIKLEPRQLREDQKAMIIGKEQNTRIMNGKIAEAIGDTSDVKYIDQKYLNSKFEDLGSKYEAIYNDPTIGAKVGLDQNAQDAITKLFVDQIPMPTAVKNRMVQGLKSVADNGFMSGEDFRFITSELKRIQRQTSDGNVKYAVGDAIDNINTSLATTNPKLKSKLDELNPKYRALMTAQEARNSDIIDANGNVDAFALGAMLRTKQDQSNPLYTIGRVGEVLGVGSHAHGERFKGNQDVKGEYLYGITPKVNILNKLAGYAKGEGIGLGIKEMQTLRGGVPSNPLLEVFKRGGPAAQTTYNQLSPKKEEY